MDCSKSGLVFLDVDAPVKGQLHIILSPDYYHGGKGEIERSVRQFIEVRGLQDCSCAHGGVNA